MGVWDAKAFIIGTQHIYSVYERCFVRNLEIKEFLPSGDIKIETKDLQGNTISWTYELMSIDVTWFGDINNRYLETVKPRFYFEILGSIFPFPKIDRKVAEFYKVWEAI